MDAEAARERARDSATDAADDEVTPPAAAEDERSAAVAAAVADKPVEPAEPEADEAEAEPEVGSSSSCGSVARRGDLSESAATERRKASAVPECQHDCDAMGLGRGGGDS